MEEWEIISVYTREQALNDGVLVDVSSLARAAGFKVPVAVTQAVWANYLEPDGCQRVWDNLSTADFGIHCTIY